MQHAIGDHALLADSRTAALIDTDGEVAWCCWPRIDSEPLFMSILDAVDGGCFSVRPAAEDAHVVQRTYDESSLILRTVWQAAGRRVTVLDSLLFGEIPTLLRAGRADDAPVDLDVMVRPRGPRASAGSRVRAHGDALVIAEPAPVRVTAPHEWSVGDDGGHCRIRASPDAPSYVLLTPDGSPRVDGATALVHTRERWRAALRGVAAIELRPEAARALGEERCRELLRVSAAVLVGLRNEEAGGIVAAPTASLPQWPGSARCWDYRYCWLRDASLAAEALLRLGLTDAAADLGDFIGHVVTGSGVRPMVRVDGSDAPPERTVPELAGYRGARPVRFGNAAAEQLQVDVAGEVLILARELANTGAVPESLATASATLAGWIESNRSTPDHGIWEIRGVPRRYTHSAVTAWAGLEAARTLVESGRIRGRGAAWHAAAEAIRAEVLASRSGALQLQLDGGGADAALSVGVETGFLAADDPVATATLDLIAAELADNDVLQRYSGSQDLLEDPCAPFIFPTFWLASAETRAGRDGSRWLRGAVATASPLGILGEVRDPGTGGPFGNFPQVQSHAALVNALVAAR
jgi:GH15 family glucan-1,4-alpha-glucosidase